MGISGIGNSYIYIYNSQTGKLSTKDGTQDDFVDYFNGDLKGGDSDTLNGFDVNRKIDIENMIRVFSAGGGGKHVFNDVGSCEYEITGEIVDAATSEYFVNGEKIFTAYHAFAYTSSELKKFGDVSQPYKTHQSKEYDPSDNSIHIAVGDSFDLGNGYKLVVKEDHVAVEGYRNDREGDNQKADRLAWGMNALILFADQLCFSGWIDAESTPMLLELLKELGVDTSKEFIINGTKCEVRHGRIREAGNNHVVPGSVYSAAMKRYEELLYQPLSAYYKEK